MVAVGRGVDFARALARKLHPPSGNNSRRDASPVPTIGTGSWPPGATMGSSSGWGRADGWRSAGSLAVEWGSVAAIGGAAIRLDSAWAYGLAVVLIGAIQHRLAALGHEAAHWSLFRNRFWNDLVGDLL